MIIIVDFALEFLLIVQPYKKKLSHCERNEKEITIGGKEDNGAKSCIKQT